jgi:hypothetical protein
MFMPSIRTPSSRRTSLIGITLGPSRPSATEGASPSFDPVVNNIQWYVFKNPQAASFSQLAWLTDYLCELVQPYLCQSNRPLQEILPDTDIYKYGRMLK